MLDVIGKALNVNRSEWRKVMMLSGYTAAALGVMVIIQSLITALFLEAYDTSYLPYLFACQAVFLIIYTLISTNRSASSARRDGTARFLIMIAVVVGASRLVVGINASWIIFALYIVLQTVSELLVVNSWIVATSQLNSREAKRLLPVISSGGRAGALFGGLAVSSLALYIGTENLLLLCVLVIGAMFFMARSMSSGQPIEAVDSKDKEKPKAKGLFASMKEIAGDLTSDRLILIFVIIFSSLIVANTIIDYQFKGILKATYTKDEIAAFIGAFYLFLSVMGFIFQLFLTSRLLVMLGLVAATAIMPSLMGAVSIGFFIFPGIWLITGVRVVENVLKYSVYKSATGLLFMPYPKLKRENLNITVEGLFKPAAILFASVLMIVLNTLSVSLQFMSVISIAACAIAAVAAMKLKAPYVEKLSTSLSNRRVRLTEDPELSNMIDNEFLSVLESNLASNEIVNIQFSLELIRDKRLPVKTEKLYPLIASEDTEVALEAIRTLGAIGTQKDIPALSGILGKSGSDEIKVACLKSLRSIGGGSVEESMFRLMETETGRVRTEVLLLILKSSNSDQKNKAIDILNRLLAAEDAEGLRMGAYIIGEAGMADYSEHLERLFGHSSDAVVNEAIVATGKLAKAISSADARERMLRPLIQCFNLGKAGNQTRMAIAAYGGNAIKTLAASYAGADDKTKLGIISTFGVIPDKQSANELFEIVARDSEAFKHRAITMLYKLNAVVKGKQYEERITAAILERAEHCDRLLDATQAIKTSMQGDESGKKHLKQFLLDEIKYKTRRTIEDVFNLLGLKYDQKTIYRIFLNTMSSSIENRANALELFENIVEKDTALRISPLIEGMAGLSTSGSGAEGSAQAAGSDDFSGRIEPTRDQWLINIASVIMKGEQKEMDIIERIFFFKNIDLFSQLSGEQLKPIASMFEEEMLPAGSVVFKENDPSDNLYIILSGKVSVTVAGNPIASLGAGDYFGEMALLDDEPRSATITLVEDTELLRLYREDFHEILDEYPEISRGIIRTLSMRLRAASKLKTATCA